MPVTTELSPIRLDRLSALLQAAAPRVLTAPPAGAHPHSLCVNLHSTAHGVPHSVVVMPSDNWTGVDTEVDRVTTVTMQVQLEGAGAALLMQEFAQTIVLPLTGADPTLTLAVQLLCTEISTPRCGQPAMLISAGNMLFIGLLRHLVAHPQHSSGLFAALADPRIATALVAMHEHPQTPWGLQSLAALAGMSRTAFATHFKDTMRTPPGRYLTQLRLLIAKREIESGKGLKSAARASGYGNVSALSRALSAHMGMPSKKRPTENPKIKTAPA
jgi:AraC-like DNA-binding protein